MNRSNDRLKHKRFGSCTHQLSSRGEGSSVVPRVKTQKVVEFTRSARSGAPEPPELPWAPRFAVIRVCKVSVWGLTLTLVLLHQGECSIVVARLAALGSFGSSSCYRLRRIKRRLFQKHRPECQTFTKKNTHSEWISKKQSMKSYFTLLGKLCCASRKWDLLFRPLWPLLLFWSEVHSLQMKGHFFTRLTLPTLEFGITDKSECLCVFMLGSTWKCVLFQPSLVRAFLSSLKLQTVCSTWEAALGSLADWLQCINMEGKRVMRNLEPSGITKIQSHLFPSSIAESLWCQSPTPVATDFSLITSLAFPVILT